MKKILLLFFGLIFSQIEVDTTINIPKIDLSKGFNIPGLIPDQLPEINKSFLLPYEIEEIKKKAKSFSPKPISENDIVIMETNRGTMKLELFPSLAPNHCMNFKKLANSGFYDGTTFHRIIPGFMIQGGDINSRDNDQNNDGRGGPGWTVDAEFNNTSHKRGILSMARSRDVNSAGSQFFICINDAPHLDNKYTAFGKVIENIHVADHIVNTPTEYSLAKRMSTDRIPAGEDSEDWIIFQDAKTGKKLYSKVPNNMNKANYEYDMRTKIKSDRPSLSLKIIKLRVVNKLNLKNIHKE